MNLAAMMDIHCCVTKSAAYELNAKPERGRGIPKLSSLTALTAIPFREIKHIQAKGDRVEHVVGRVI